MFDLPAIDPSSKVRSSGALWLSEVVATAGLLLVIHGCVRSGLRQRRRCRRRRVDRWRLLLHLVDQLRQPGLRHRPHPLRHFRRHRTLVSADVHRHAARRVNLAARPSASSSSIYEIKVSSNSRFSAYIDKEASPFTSGDARDNTAACPDGSMGFGEEDDRPVLER